MRLEEFERTGSGDRPRYVIEIEDAAGDSAYELVVTGTPVSIGQIMENADFEVMIDSSATRERAEEELRSTEGENDQAAWEMAGLLGTDDLFKDAPERLDIRRSVLTSLRRVRGGQGHTTKPRIPTSVHGPPGSTSSRSCHRRSWSARWWHRVRETKTCTTISAHTFNRSSRAHGRGRWLTP